jgi:hypothetical protein
MVNVVNIALFSCSSIGVAVGQLAVLPFGDRVASSSLRETLDSKRYCCFVCSCTLEVLHVAKRDNIKMAIKEIMWESINWIHLVHM